MSRFLQAREKLQSIGQERLLFYWDLLSPLQQKALLSQIEQLDLKLFRAQRSLLSHAVAASSGHFLPFKNYEKNGSAEDLVAGRALVAAGQVGCLLVAGGQGSRLRFNAPKGLFPVTVVHGKTLFQLHAERVKAAGRQVGRALPLAIMTSPVNHEATVAYFEENEYFGLEKEKLSFFSQGSLPLLDEEGNLFLEAQDKIAEGPDGNGTSLKYFVSSGLWEQWWQQGVRYLNFIIVDNALADPFDYELIGFLKRKKTPAVIKCIERQDPAEKVGVIVMQQDKFVVVEYSELPWEELSARDKNGLLKHRCANISLFCFEMECVADMAQKEPKASLHKAWKRAKVFDPRLMRTSMSDKAIAWKFEKFIFDLLPSAEALLYPRYRCFAPLKNEEGKDSLNDVQAALQHFDREAWASFTGTPPPDEVPFELPVEFHYPKMEDSMKINKHSRQFVLAVDRSDQPLGLVEKQQAHRQGVLHRAFSIFLFRTIGSSLQVLLQQRAGGKYHSAELWTNTCCSHAEEVLSLEITAQNRLKMEMGFCCELYSAGSFYYKADVGNGLVEHEIDHVFVGLHDPELICPDPLEVKDYQWIDVESLLKLSLEKQKTFTAWFFPAFEVALKFLSSC